jgi:putative membrane protein
MGFTLKFIIRGIVNGLVLYGAGQYLSGFAIYGGWEVVAIAALLLALLNTFLKPIIKVITAPIVWLTLGLFNFVIHGTLLWVADQLLGQIEITSLTALAIASVFFAFANALI